MGRRSFPGGIISSTEPTVNGFGASGMWTTQTAAQKKNAGFWPIPGITPSGPLVGPTIANVAVTDSNYTVLNDTPYINSSGGYIRITGTGFASGAVVYVGGSAAVTTSFVNSTEVRAQIGAGSTSNAFPVYVVNTDSSVAIRLAAVVYSGLPTWTTAAALSNQVVDAAFSISLSATSDSAITYSLAAGSSLPPGTSLSSGGLFSGTVTGLIDETTYSFSVVANDAENQDASRTFTVTVAIGDQYFNLTPLLLNGEANVWIRDSSVNNLLPTVFGDTRPTAFSPYNTTWSALFDANGDYISTPSSATLTPQSTFTVECWIYGIAGAGIIIDNRPATTNGAYFQFSASSGRIEVYVNGAVIGQTAVLISNSVWYHVAYVRTGGTGRIYIDGLQRASFADTTTYIETVWKIGYAAFNSGWFNGYISNLRYVNGTAVFTGNFTPQTSSLSSTQSAGTNIAAITGTSTALLTLQDSRFKDNSSNAFTLTRFGDAAIRSFGPFIDTDTVTGSGYFDGTGDYLSIGTAANWVSLHNTAAQWTIEFWVYPITYNGSLLETCDSSSQTGIFLGFDANGLLVLQIMRGVTSSFVISGTGNVASPRNVWTHIQLSYDFNLASNNMSMYVNGVANTASAGSFNKTANAPSGSNPTSPLYVGYSTSSQFQGYITDLRIRTGVAVSTAPTLPTTTIANVANTSLLTLQYRRGDNNHRFVDESGIKSLTTRAGNAHQGSFSPFSPAGWSGYFDGSTSYLNSTIGTLSGTWTVEFWVYMPVLGVQYTFINLNSGGAGGVNIWRNTSNQLVVDDGANAQTAFSTVTFATAGVWYHVAVTRNGTTTTGYINGAVAGTNTFTPASVNAVTIGRYNNNPFYYLLGYMSNLRIVDGVVVYTGVFTPPTTALTATQSVGTNIAAITAGQTLLLTLQDNRFVDNSTTPKTLTRTGSLFIQAFSPFRGSGFYTPATQGGSVYLDGSGDYVYVTTSPAMTFGTNDHCIEFWMYPNGAQAQYSVPWYYDGAILYYFSIGSDSNQAFLLVGGGSPWSLAITILNAEYVRILNNWTHVVITRTGTAFRVVFNGRLVGYGTTAQSIAAPNPTFSIGWDLVNATTLYKGWLSGFRIINGSVPTAYQTASTTLGTTVFAVPTAVPAFEANTVMAMNFTHGGIVDATGRTTFETVGTVTVSNTQSKFGIGSLYFDGSNTQRVLAGANNINFDVSSGDFTVECWLYITSVAPVSQLIVYRGDSASITSGTQLQWSILLSSSTLSVRPYQSTTATQIDVGTVVINTWYHVALVRNGNLFRGYLNGTASATTHTITGALNNNTGWPGMTIGGINDNGSQRPYYGYIDDLRVTRFARYTANFTVPSTAFLTK